MSKRYVLPTGRAWIGRLIQRGLRALMILVFGLSGILHPGMVQPAAAFEIPSIPTPLVVTTLALANDSEDGQCDLWEALKLTFDLKQMGQTTYHECNAAGAKVMGSTIIAFSPGIWGGTIQLPAPGPYPEFPYIIDDITLLGPITIDGGGQAAEMHIFRVGPEGKLTLIGMTLTNGYTSGSGGAILSTNYGEINLIASSIVGNTAESDGGAIDTNGNISITATNFSGNVAKGVMPDGVTDASGVGFGGALSIYGDAKLSVTASTFNGNIADKGGGAIHFSGKSMEVSNSTFNGNLVVDTIPTSVTDALRGGGAIYLDTNATLKVEKTAFDGNLSWVAPAGAIFVAMDSIAEVVDSSFNANAAGDLSHAMMGGAIYNTEALTVTRSAFLFNVATDNGGALVNDRGAQANLYNVTFAGNGAPNGDGGALWNGNTHNNNLETKARIYNVTFSDNLAASAGAVYNEIDGDNLVEIGNSILNQGVSAVANCNTGLQSAGHNIDSGVSCALVGNADQSNTNPLLEGLGFNGGPIFSLLSIKLQSGCPALEAGDADFCAMKAVSNQDQRGEKRPQDGDGDESGGCDIGAVENDGLKAGYGSIPVQPGPIHVGAAHFGESAAGRFTVYETGTRPLVIESAALSGPNASECAMTNSLPLNIPSVGMTWSAMARMSRCRVSAPSRSRQARWTLARWRWEPLPPRN